MRALPGALAGALVVTLLAFHVPPAVARGGGPVAMLLLKDGSTVEGPLETAALTFTVDGRPRRVALRDLRSFHSADPAEPDEAARIAAGLSAVVGKDRGASEAAVASLTDLGLPVISPLLALYKDTDGHEPDPLYRLFGRIVPGFADGADRRLDLVRLGDGSALRGKLTAATLKVDGAEGGVREIASERIRRLAPRQSTVERTFDLDALRHCTYVSWLDTGIGVSVESRLHSEAAGYARLSFDEDGWASDPDGIKDPLPGKRRLQEGFRWGAILGRVGPAGERWLVGKHLERSGLGSGRLYFVINDNEHWQNNIGSYRVKLRVTNAYDLGQPQ